ncbi:ribokinase [Aquamicrobium sp. LC103]|uniref:ribokinase n=1 Tax=Aquamicrobium sp. LC103 TaxID=1120658 RepID=UPI00063EC49B|nr:ribokinase [Aquamicrobium sp. LC103]TKT82647.1 ribokinase [Aquamicrobium sp. LC103]
MITIIGSINLDLIATVGRLPAPGETVPGDDFSTAPGGKGANQALAARRAGAKVRMVGAVGSDAFAEEALALLEEGQVDLSCVRRSHAATGTALILVGSDGENMIAVIPGGNGTVLPGDVAAADIRAGDYILFQHEIPIDTVRSALAAAREKRAVSLLNTAPFRTDAADLLAEADYVIANETEFDLYAGELGLSGGDRKARMQDFAARTGRTVVVTLGADGVVAAAPDTFLAVAGLDIVPVDTVGAGDTFCGYLAAGIEAGLDLEQALRRAAVAGSIACLKPGAQPSIPLAAEVDAALG